MRLDFITIDEKDGTRIVKLRAVVCSELREALDSGEELIFEGKVKNVRYLRDGRMIMTSDGV